VVSKLESLNSLEKLSLKKHFRWPRQAMAV
jgi:hypothetical protein